MENLININLRVFDIDLNTQVSDNNPTSLMPFYDRNIILNAKSVLVHDQFGQQRPIPKNGGKKIQFRKLSPLPKALKPLSEGVSPNGNDLTWSTIESTLGLYGDYITVSDVLQLTSIDNNLIEAGELLAMQAGETLDAVTREVLNTGTNVQYADGQLARFLLKGGDSTYANNDYLTVNTIKRAVRTLKRNKAKKIDGFYIGIIHPDVAYDLMSDPMWENVKTYADPKDMYNGEIGRLHGVRFVETSEAKIFTATDLTVTARNLTVASYNAVNKTITVDENIDSKLVERKIIVKGLLYTVEAVAGKIITVKEAINTGDLAPVAGSKVYPGEAGADGRDVYSTLILGADAYGVTELEGGGLRNIVKQLGSGGTADPLDQRATTGWKALKTAEILVQEFLVRVETAASY